VGILQLAVSLLAAGALAEAAAAVPLRPREARADVLVDYQEVGQSFSVSQLEHVEFSETIDGPSPGDFVTAGGAADNDSASASSFAELAAASAFPRPSPVVQSEGFGILVSHWIVTGDPAGGLVDVDITLSADAFLAAAFPGGETDSVRSLIGTYFAINTGGETRLMSAFAILRTFADGTHTLEAGGAGADDGFEESDFTPADPGDEFDVAYTGAIDRHFEDRFLFPVGTRFGMVLQVQSLVVALQPSGRLLADFTRGASFVMSTDTPGAGIMLVPEPSLAWLVLAAAAVLAARRAA
jgi:hypothetical protein